VVKRSGPSKSASERRRRVAVSSIRSRRGPGIARGSTLWSNGRVEFGTGRSTTMDELLGFACVQQTTRPRWAAGRSKRVGDPEDVARDPFSIAGKY